MNLVLKEIRYQWQWESMTAADCISQSSQEQHGVYKLVYWSECIWLLAAENLNMILIVKVFFSIYDDKSEGGGCWHTLWGSASYTNTLIFGVSFHWLVIISVGRREKLHSAMWPLQAGRGPRELGLPIQPTMSANSTFLLTTFIIIS